MRVGELLRPISWVMAKELLVGDYIQADDTPVESKFTMVAARTIQPICGNIVGQPER